MYVYTELCVLSVIEYFIDIVPLLEVTPCSCSSGCATAKMQIAGIRILSVCIWPIINDCFI